MQQKIVFIGGPGTGKTSILNELIKRDYKCLPEISREVTLQAQKDGVDQLFLTEPLLFSEKLLEGRENQYLQSNTFKNNIVFFDRGIPSIYAYLKYFNTKFPDIFIEKSKKYRYTKVFQFLPWEKIYTSDNERYESFQESSNISKYLYLAYKELGYTIINVPFGTVNERCNFILNSI